MEAAHRPRLSARPGICARSRHMREMRRRHRRVAAGRAKAGLRRAPPIPQTMEPSRRQPQIALGRRSCCAGRGGRRAVRSLEYANPLSAVPPQSDSGLTGSAEVACFRGNLTMQREVHPTSVAHIFSPTDATEVACTGRFYFLNSLSKASRASLAVRGTAEHSLLESCLPGPCADEASRATVTRGEQRAIVLLILHGDPNGYRLHALKTCRRLEVGTLLAAVQCSAALRTRSMKGRARGERRRAVVTA